VLYMAFIFRCVFMETFIDTKFNLNAVDLTTKIDLSLVIIGGCDIWGDKYQQPSKPIKGDKKCHKKLKKMLSLA